MAFWLTLVAIGIILCLFGFWLTAFSWPQIYMFVWTSRYCLLVVPQLRIAYLLSYIPWFSIPGFLFWPYFCLLPHVLRLIRKSQASFFPFKSTYIILECYFYKNIQEIFKCIKMWKTLFNSSYNLMLTLESILYSIMNIYLCVL